MNRHWVTLVVASLSLALALGGVGVAAAAHHRKHHKVCYRGRGRHRHRVKCHKRNTGSPSGQPAGCVALPPTGSTPGVANGRVVLEAGTGSGGTVNVLGLALRENTVRFICAEHTVVSITAVPDAGWTFGSWTASDDGDPSFTCPDSSTTCTVTLVNHKHADNLGPAPPDDYSVSANFLPG